MKVSLALKHEIEHAFEIVEHRSTNDELCFVCPEPGCNDRSGNRSVNLKTGMTNCWRCGKGGHIIGWARKLGYRFSGGMEGVNSGLAELEEQVIGRTRLPAVQAVQMPRGFVPISQEPSSVYTRLITEMAVRKNLTYEDLAQAHVGFTRIDPVWEAYALFPVVEYNLIVYWQGRTYTDKPGESTKRFPGRREITYGARYWVYNIDELRAKQAPIVLVVESILNVLSLKWKLAELGWDQQVVPVAVFKHTVSVEQWIKITRCAHVKEVCLLFDHDATRRAWDSSAKLCDRVGLSVAEMPAGPDNTKLDPNDDVEAAIEAFERRQPYTAISDLAHRLKDVEIPSMATRRICS